MSPPHLTAAPTGYRGRFAPTPSGPLHLGSLLTALAGWLQARRRGGVWMLRFDDLDAARCPPGMDQLILRQLAAHGLEWDEPVIHQRHRLEVYRTGLQILAEADLLFACRCTRRELKQRSHSGPDDLVYDGRCRDLGLPWTGHALRIRVGDGQVGIDDAWQGRQERDLRTEVGDFVVARSDGVPGYQLASVLDDRDMRITEVVRGSDLLGSSLRQRHLFERLGLPAPQFRHVPVLVDAQGLKLSKQNHAHPLDESRASRNLWQCLDWLGQCPPPDLSAAAVSELLDWARLHWNEARIPRRLATALEAPA